MRTRFVLLVLVATLISLTLIGCTTYTTKYSDARDFQDAKQYPESVKTYNEFIAQKKSPKLEALHPDAAFNIGLCYKAMKKTKQAKAAFQNVLDKYPKSKAAAEAKTELTALK